MDPTLIIFLLLMIGMMWFMTSRGKKRVAAERARLEETLVPGASVMTIGGFLGRIVDIDGDVITLESPSGVETIWMRTAIKEVKEPPFAAVETDESDERSDGEAVIVPDDASALTPDATDAPARDVRAPGVERDATQPGSDDDGREPGTTPRA
ncbi:preprotein translocase subunit YajC [Georgenia subflava]|uniref:Preprotein translocase subunit YajC n=1 Tax=Georgenia subflava TaxID=1622177 RepID=A0A6N7ERD5_9MICO|nr:preprotein translocase subunit YajC [Georgenia subflava]MPV37734.1 preprotein translocase subunit YajC [Georgenia subflava]